MFINNCLHEVAWCISPKKWSSGRSFSSIVFLTENFCFAANIFKSFFLTQKYKNMIWWFVARHLSKGSSIDKLRFVKDKFLFQCLTEELKKTFICKQDDIFFWTKANGVADEDTNWVLNIQNNFIRLLQRFIRLRLKLIRLKQPQVESW